MGTMRDAGRPGPETVPLATVLAAIADPHRLGVMRRLVNADVDEEVACGRFELPVGKSTRSHHFVTLRDAGLITLTSYGNHSTVQLRREHIRQHHPGLLDLLADSPDRSPR